MSDEIIVKQCSPTLAGIKTGNIFLTDYETKEELVKDLRSINNRLSHKGVRVIPVYFNGNKVLIYVYRPVSLEKDLKNQEAYSLLCEMGYKCSTTEQYLAKLIFNYKETRKIPHEIGLFLGYPPIDVRGFIENKAQNYKSVGTWKVYGDEEEAKKTFRKYKLCSASYYNQWSKGQSIERLTVVA